MQYVMRWIQVPEQVPDVQALSGAWAEEPPSEAFEGLLRDVSLRVLFGVLRDALGAR